MKTLGIDVGTGGSRALIMDETGRVVGSATHDHVAFASPEIGWAEQDPHDWWAATRMAIRKVLGQTSTTSDEIAAVALTGQMHGAVLLDDKDEVLRPALIWCDQRTAEECVYLNETIGSDRIIDLTCNPALTNFTLTKLLWVRKHEPEIWKRFRSFLLPKDYVRMRMTGVKAIDVAEASGTLLLDVANRRWSKEMMGAVGLDEHCAPQVFESPEVVGRISVLGAAETGLKVGTPVIAGAGDQAAGAVGMGIVSTGAVSATIGTSGVVFAATDRPALDPRGRVHTFCHAVPGRWHVMGVTQAAGLSLRWFRDNFGAGSDDGRDPYERLCQEAAKAKAGEDGVYWTPYLMGERTPHLDPEARAALVGLNAKHGRGTIIRAILEGVAFSLRDTFSIFDEMRVPVTEVRLGGGGARAELWRQIQAEIYGRTVSTVKAEEGAAYGAAILAGVGVGQWPDVESACHEVVKIDRVVDPDRKSAEIMNSCYEVYRRIYPALAPLFHPAAQEAKVETA